MIYLSEIPSSLVFHYLTYDKNEKHFISMTIHTEQELLKYTQIPILASDSGEMVEAVYLLTYKGKAVPKKLPKIDTNTTYICFDKADMKKWFKLFEEDHIKPFKINLAKYTSFINKEPFSTQGFEFFWELCITKFQCHIPKWIHESYKLSIYKEDEESLWTGEELNQMFLSKTSKHGYNFTKQFVSKDMLKIANLMTDSELYMSIVGTSRNNHLVKSIAAKHPKLLYPLQLLIEALIIPTVKPRHGVAIFYKWLQTNRDDKTLRRLLNL